MEIYKTFETERLLIRPTQIEDAAFVLQLLNTPKWIEFIGDRNVKTLDDSIKYIENRMLPQLHRLGYSNNTIILKATQQKIGSIGLYDREGLDGVDIGFAFLPTFENKGYAFEASVCLLDAAHLNFGINTVSAITSKNNISSQKLIEKLGLKLEGKITLPNEHEELLLYKITDLVK